MSSDSMGSFTTSKGSGSGNGDKKAKRVVQRSLESRCRKSEREKKKRAEFDDMFKDLTKLISDSDPDNACNLTNCSGVGLNEKMNLMNETMKFIKLQNLRIQQLKDSMANMERKLLESGYATTSYDVAATIAATAVTSQEGSSNLANGGFYEAALKAKEVVSPSELDFFDSFLGAFELAETALGDNFSSSSSASSNTSSSSSISTTSSLSNTDTSNSVTQTTAPKTSSSSHAPCA